jgi:hypothetical protein
VQDIKYQDDGFPYCRSCTDAMAESMAVDNDQEKGARADDDSALDKKDEANPASVTAEDGLSGSSSTGLCAICKIHSKVFVIFVCFLPLLTNGAGYQVSRQWFSLLSVMHRRHGREPGSG